MITEPGQNIFFGGGLNNTRAPQKYRGAPWCYPSPIKISGGSVMLSEPHQKQLGGGADDIWAPPTYGVGLKDIWAPPKYGGGGVLNDIRVPPKYLGISMISEIHQIYFFGSMICEIRCLSPPPPSPPPLPPPKKKIFIKCLYLNGKSVDYRYTWASCLEHNGWGGEGLMISEPRNKYRGRLNDIWAPLKQLGAQWYLSPLRTQW